MRSLSSITLYYRRVRVPYFLITIFVRDHSSSLFPNYLGYLFSPKFNADSCVDNFLKHHQE